MPFTSGKEQKPAHTCFPSTVWMSGRPPLSAAPDTHVGEKQSIAQLWSAGGRGGDGGARGKVAKGGDVEEAGAMGVAWVVDANTLVVVALPASDLIYESNCPGLLLSSHFSSSTPARTQHPVPGGCRPPLFMNTKALHPGVLSHMPAHASGVRKAPLQPGSRAPSPVPGTRFKPPWPTKQLYPAFFVKDPRLVDAAPKLAGSDGLLTSFSLISSPRNDADAMTAVITSM